MNALADKRISDCDVLELGENIRAIRRKKKMTQKELGEAAFMSDKALSRIEKGNIIPGVDKIFDIADGLGVTPMDLSPKRYKEQLLQNNTQDELLLLHLWKSMDDEKRKLALNMMAMIVGN